MAAFDFLWSTVERVRGAPVERKLAEWVKSDRVHDDRFPDRVDGQKFQSGGSYFAVRLAGLHVVEARQFGTKRFPLFVSLAEFKQRGQDRSIPFSIGPREILGKLQAAGALTDKDAKPGWVELQDLMALPPTPAGTGGLSLFVGLYSVPGDDIVRTLLNVVGDLSKSAGGIGAAAKPALDIAKTVYDGVGSLIGLNSLQPLAQAQNGQALHESGYFVVGNAPPDTLADLLVLQGKLCRGTTMVTDFDYCLVAIERYATVLEEATGVAPDLFDDGWQQVVSAFGRDDAAAAKAALRRLIFSIRASPALIDKDRSAAITAYLSKYAEEAAIDDKIKTRGAGDELAQALGAAQAGLSENPVASEKFAIVSDMIDQAQKAPGRTKKQSTLSLAAEMRQKLLEVGEGGDEALADALLRAV